jgi:flagellar biosynthetic protein FlhB
MAEDMGERTEAPSGRRISEARSRGQIARSTDLTAAIDLIGGVVLITVMGATGVAILGRLMRRILQNDTPGDLFDLESIRPLVVYSALQAGKVVLPALLATMLVGIIGNFIQVGSLITFEPLKPNWARLNPFSGIGRLFGMRNTVRTGVGIVKLGVVGLVSGVVIARHFAHIAALPNLGVFAGVWFILKMSIELAAWLLALLLVLGLIDYFYQRWQHTKDLRMTKQEVKDERRSMDGDPEIKSKRARMAREIAYQRIRQDVPRADVIVTNPTHFSVALKYDQKSMRAPKVVAKGADDIAFRIRELGVANGVPIVERPPLARALFWGVDVGREIAPEFYEAVAEVLAYVYRLERRAAEDAPEASSIEEPVAASN